MKSWRYVGLTLAIASLLQLLYTLIVAACASQTTMVDAFSGQHTIFETEAKSVVYNTPLIARRAKKPEIVILGASNAAIGLRPLEISGLVGDVPVHNLSIGGQNMRSLSQLVDLIYRQTPAAQRSNIVFVIGSWYGLTVEDVRRWPTGRTDVDEELTRYGVFYTNSKGMPISRVRDAELSPALMATWPFMVPFSLYSQFSRYLMQIGRIHFIPPGVILTWYPPEKARNEAQMTNGELKNQAESFVDYVGPVREWKDTGFANLKAIADRIAKERGYLVVLDMPATSWCINTDAFPAYQKRMNTLMQQEAHNPHIVYANLQSGFMDDDFFDAIHPRPRTTLRIAQRAAIPINIALNRLIENE